MLAPDLFPLIDFDRFHAELPERMAAAAPTPFAWKWIDGARPLALQLTDGRAYSYVPRSGGVNVVRGVVDGAAVVEIDAERWSDYASELHTSFGILYGGFATGALDQLIHWEVAVRAMYSGREAYDPSLVELDGIDIGRSFDADAPLDSLRDFFRATGYLHVRGVFKPNEVAAMRDEIERLQAIAAPGDDRSWWARNAAGDNMLCRLTYVNERSELLGNKHEDLRVTRIVDALRGRTPLVPTPTNGDGHSVVLKNPGAVEGLSDLPWHVDCGLGGHPVMCPAINVGVQIDAATPETGQLHFMAGSNRFSSSHLGGGVPAGSPTVAIETQPGDLTFHSTDTLHLAPPPTASSGRGRRAMYLTFSNPLSLQVVPAGSGYNDVVLKSNQGNRVLSVEEKLAAG